jgi:hypothetical protein
MIEELNQLFLNFANQLGSTLAVANNLTPLNGILNNLLTNVLTQVQQITESAVAQFQIAVRYNFHIYYNFMALRLLLIDLLLN